MITEEVICHTPTARDHVKTLYDPDKILSEPGMAIRVEVESELYV
jgi:hypothetical protein